LGEGFLAKDMLAHLQRAQRGDGMVMVGNGHRHRVDGGIHFFEHGAEILVNLGVGNFGRHFLRVCPVHVA
jgi:hypothetical protein